MMRSGKGTETASTTSTGSSGVTRSNRSSRRSRATASSAVINDGLNPGWTSLRYAVWSGGSVCIIVGGDGYSMPISMVRIPPLELNRRESVETSWTSSYRLSAQNPCVAFQATGASARSRA